MRQRPKSPNTRTRSRLMRPVLAAGAFALVAASCASDADDSAAPSDVAESVDTVEVIQDEQPGETANTEPAESTVSTTQPVGTSAPTTDPAPEVVSSVKFEPCGDGAECAMVDVPLDYAAPDGDTVQIHVTRVAAGGDRIGNLFLNPGGPGVGSEDFIRGVGGAGSLSWTDRFDLVGIDNRGTGRSNAIDCNDDDLADAERFLTYQPEDVDAYIADFTELAAACDSAYDVEYLASLTTENAARDMETVRLALGGESLNFYGGSYGTVIGSVYATMFPDSIRSMVLDAAAPTDPEDGTFVARAAGFNDALVKLDTSCALWAACPLGDVGLIDAIDQVAAMLEADGNIGDLDAQTFGQVMGLLLAAPPALADVATGLADALDGNGSLLAEIGASQLTMLPDSDQTVGSSGSYNAIICADGWNIETSTVDELADQAAQWFADAPILGGNWETPCDLWPVTGPGLPAVDYTGDAPMLVIGNVGDPITPLTFGEDLVDALGSTATLLTFGGGGHTAGFQGIDCIDDYMSAFFVEVASPEVGAYCEERGLVGIGYPDGSPVVIDRVTANSPAEQAGVLLGDVILQADGTDVFSQYDVPSGVRGEPLDLVIDRDGEIIELTIIRGPAFWEFWRLAEE